MSTNQPDTVPSSGEEPAAERPTGLRPRTGPIVWGAILLAFCAFVLQREFAPGTIDTANWLIAVTIGLGVLLLAVGAAVVIRSRR